MFKNAGRVLWALLVGASLMGLGFARAAEDPDEPAAGVSLQLAKARAGSISQLRYELSLSIPRSRAEPVTGSNVLRFRLADAAQPLVIDFDAEGAAQAIVTANGVRVPTRAVNGHLLIAPAHLRRGENSIRIDFRAGDAPLNRNDDFLYTLFVPARARQTVPCFDQPDLKGRWTVQLEHPATWQSVANGAELERLTTGDRVRVHFAQTQPLPTYLVAFVVGDMKVEARRIGDREMRLFHRENDAAKLARNRDALFDLHAQSLAALEAYTGIAYPFDKFDFVLVPALQFAGMEHAGAIVYRAEDLLLDEAATQEELLGRSHLIAHETAHMWFGDLVTMRWFDDVWTKEVFANFIASKLIEPQFPQVRHDLQFFLAHHGGAYAVDRSAGANPIRQPLANLAQAGSLYGPIIYMKSPVVIRHLEALLGETAFRDGVRQYLRRHAFGNATWDDLIDALAGHTRLDLRQWSRMWIDETGRPEIRTELELKNGRVLRLALQQRDPQGRGRVWPQQLRVTISCGAQRRTLPVELLGSEADLSQLLGECVPDYVLAGGEGWGYGDFQLDEHSRAYLSQALHRVDDPLARGVAWSALWDAMLAGRIAPDRLYDVAMLSLQHESEAQLIGAMLYDLGTLWWRFLTPPQRDQRAAALEALLRARLDPAPTAGLKSTWFGALRALATTPATVAWMRALWQREATIPGLPLVEADETTLAYALAVRAVEGGNGASGAEAVKAMLDTQRERIDNPDRRARFDFVRPAVSPDAAERTRWFAALQDPALRRREVWVSEGLRVLHHPLRAEASAGHVRPALDMLLEVHRTGDLFFDMAWVGSVLSGHGTPAVAATVQQFIDGLPPDYPPQLRALVLQRADLLMRAARWRTR